MFHIANCRFHKGTVLTEITTHSIPLIVEDFLSHTSLGDTYQPTFVRRRQDNVGEKIKGKGTRAGL